MTTVTALPSAAELPAAPLGKLEMQTGDDAWTVTFGDVDPDFTAEELASEFANYVLAQTIERRH